MRDTVRSSIAPFQCNETSALVSIELKHLRYAEVAERCGSFRKAAELLAIKQSNLSRRVRHLEEQLGIALFERTNGGVRPASRILAGQARTQCLAPEFKSDPALEASRLRAVSVGHTHCRLKRRENLLLRRLGDIEAHEASSGLRQAERVPGSEHDVLG